MQSIPGMLPQPQGEEKNKQTNKQRNTLKRLEA